MNPLRSMASHRVHTRQGPEPLCPEHGTMAYTRSGWRCQWSRWVRKEDSWGGLYWATLRCEYKHTDRRETEVEAWEEPDDGIRLGGERQ